MPQQALLKRPIHRRGFVSPDFQTTQQSQLASKRVLIPYTPVKLDDLNPLMRNDNVTTSGKETKVGPSAWMSIGGQWHGWVEGIQNTGFPTSPSLDGMTAMMKVTAPTLQGPFTFNPATTRIRDASDETTWEHWEHSFADIVLSGGNLIAMYHGGNNSGPQSMGLDVTPNTVDGSSGWVADARNPVLVVGATGAWDDRQCANDFKLVRYRNRPGNPFTGALWGVYRGRKTGSFTDGLMGRATVSADYLTFTKDPPATAGQVIFAAPSWNASGGRTSGTPVLDEGGRAHMWYPGGPNGIGKSYSDDDGYTWVDENGGAAVLSPTGTVGAYDKQTTGDVVQAIWDTDVAFLLYGTENISDYPTNSPMRGASGAIVPFPVVSPQRPGKFHLSNARTIVDTTAANAIVSPLNLTIYTMGGRFKAYRTSRAVPRRLFACVDASDTFNRAFSVSIESSTGSGLGSAGAGRLHVFHRTSGGIVELWSDAVVDDALWHTWELRRIGLASWEFYVDDVKQTGTNGTSSTSVSLDSAAVNKTIGNMPTTSGTPNQPANLTQSNVYLCNGYAMSTAEHDALINSGTAPSSGTLTINWPLNSYADSGNVVTVEAQGIVRGGAVGSIAFTGSSTAAVKVHGADSGSLPLTGSATGTVTSSGIRATANGSLPLSGSATAAVKAKAAAASTLPLSGSAAAKVKVKDAGSGSLPLTGSAAGKVKVQGTEAQTLGFTGAATGAVKVKGSANDNLALTGSAAAFAGKPIGPPPGSRTGAVRRHPRVGVVTRGRRAA